MSLGVIVIVFIVCFIGSILQGVIGIGFAVFLMSTLPFFIPLRTVASIELLLGTVTTISLLFPIIKHAKWRYIIVPTLSTMVFTNLGVYFLMNYNTAAMQLYLGVSLVVFSIIITFFIGKVKVKPTIKNGVLAGAVSGFLGGAFNIAGPPLAMYYFSLFDSVEEYEASIQLTFLLSGAYKIALFLYFGNINSIVIKYTAIGFFAVIAGSLISLKMIKNIDKATLKKGLAIFMAAMGIMLVFKGVK